MERSRGIDKDEPLPLYTEPGEEVGIAGVRLAGVWVCSSTSSVSGSGSMGYGDAEVGLASWVNVWLTVLYEVDNDVDPFSTMVLTLTWHVTCSTTVEWLQIVLEQIWVIVVSWKTVVSGYS